MNFNHLFRKGSTHKVCQDYSLTRESEICKLALMSDGCSGSPDTDFGSRLLVSNMAKLMQNSTFQDISFACQLASINASRDAFSLGYSSRCLDATLGGIYYDKSSNKVDAFLYGDGVVILKSPDTDYITVYKRSFYTDSGQEMPVYPIYKHLNLDISHINYKFEQFLVYKDRTEVLNGYDGPAEQKAFWISPVIWDIEFLAVCSDGINTFIKNKDAFDFSTVIRELFFIKNKKGEYLERHYNFLLSDYKIDHSDDLSIVSMVK